MLRQKTFGSVQIKKKGNGKFEILVPSLFPTEQKTFETALLKFARSFNNINQANRQAVKMKGVK